MRWKLGFWSLPALSPGETSFFPEARVAATFFKSALPFFSGQVNVNREKPRFRRLLHTTDKSQIRIRKWPLRQLPDLLPQ